MTGMKKSILSQAHIEDVPVESIISNHFPFMEFNINEIKGSDIILDREFTLVVNKNSELNGFLLYFDTFFERDCENPISFSTGPHSIPTHWGQALLPLEEIVNVEKDDILEGRILMEPLKSRKFLIEIHYKIEGKLPLMKRTFHI